MKQLSLRRLSPHEAVQAFCELLKDELDYRGSHGLDMQDLQRYYQNLFCGDGKPSSLGIYGYASRLAPVLQALGKGESAVRLLDAGCGYGTESLLFALSGADVTGVELVSERVELARSRVSFYQSSVLHPLSIQFVNADVMRHLEGAGSFDIIWVMEAVSHIHPLETFLSLAYRNLSLGGLLITSDPNAMNPVALYRACRIRRSTTPTLRVKANDPDSGAPVYEAVERIFPVTAYTRKLKETGFTIQQITMSGFMASSLVPSPLHRSRLVFILLTSLQRVFQTLPALRLIGTIYTVVAQKECKGHGTVRV